MAKKVFKNNAKRSEKIKTKMTADYARPVVVFGYFTSQADACEALKCNNSMLNKGIKRQGTTRGMRVIKGYNVDKAIALLVQLHDLI